MSNESLTPTNCQLFSRNKGTSTLSLAQLYVLYYLTGFWKRQEVRQFSKLTQNWIYKVFTTGLHNILLLFISSCTQKNLTRCRGLTEATLSVSVTSTMSTKYLR